MDWNMIKVICIIFGIQGGLLIAAAKSLFVTKKQIYDKNGITIFVPRQEWESNRDERERRRDLGQKSLCRKIEKMSESMDSVFEEIRKDIKRLIEKTSERRSGDKL